MVEITAVDKHWIWIPMAAAQLRESSLEGDGIWIPMGEVAPSPSDKPPTSEQAKDGIWIPIARFASAVDRAQVGQRGKGAGIWIPMDAVVAAALWIPPM